MNIFLLHRWGTGLLTLLVPLSMFAADLKFGYVDTARIFQEAAPAVAIKKRLESEFATRRNELDKMKERAEALEKLLLQNNKLDPEDKKRYDREYAALERDYRAKERELLEDFAQRRNEAFAAVLEQANRAVKEIAKREHYDLILQDAVYVDSKFDLTPKVLKELKK